LARPDSLSWSRIANGGGASTNSFFALSGSIGQAAAETIRQDSGSSDNGFYQIAGGFWAASLRSKPLFARPPFTIPDAELGGTVTFAANPVGTPPFQFQWQLNGVNLLGATNETLSLTNVQLAHGGTYTCAIRNEFGVTNTPAELQFNLPTFPPQQAGRAPLNDNFADRIAVGLTTNAFRSSNVGATNETGEPIHAGKLGGASVWFTWSTNASGIATFRTEGSAFDTLLAVYTGNSLDTLVEAAEDDDFIGSYTSEVRFNVSPGIVYLIAVDGIGGRVGNFVVSWEFTNTTERLPRITCHPQSQAVRLGTNTTATFAVEVEGGNEQPGLQYQWQFLGNPIPNATNATLTISNVTPFKLGLYTVAVTNAAHQGLESHFAALEDGPKSSAVSYNKIEDLLLHSGAFGVLPEPCASGRPPAFRAAGASLAIQSVSFGVGSADSQRFVNKDGFTGQCANSCDDLGGAAKYFGLQPTNSGVLVLSTSGSTNRTDSKSLDTILLVYEYQPNFIDLNNNLYKNSECSFQLACDDDGGGSDRSSQLSISVTANRYYVIEVDGKNGEKGDVVLTWRLEPPATPFESYDGALYLAAATNISLYPYITNYFWFANGVFLPGKSERRLLLEGPISPATTYAVAMYVQNTNTAYWSVERLTNTLGTIVSASIRKDPSGSSAVQLLLPGLAPEAFRTNLQVEGAMPSANSSSAAWPWQAVTNLRTSTQGNDLLLSLPTNKPAQVLRIRPKPR
jgi:hypothetical protein